MPFPPPKNLILTYRTPQDARTAFDAIALGISSDLIQLNLRQSGNKITLPCSVPLSIPEAACTGLISIVL